MNNFKYYLLVLAFSFTFLSFSQEKTVMIKSVETYGSFAAMSKSLHIIDENDVLTTIDLEKHNTKGIPNNMLVIKKAIDDYLVKGYKIISSTGVSFGENGVYTVEHTYILRIENED